MEKPPTNFVHEPPVSARAYRLIHVPSTACDAIIFKAQEQLCHRTCTGGRDLSNRVMIVMHDSVKKADDPKNSEENLVSLPTCT